VTYAAHPSDPPVGPSDLGVTYTPNVSAVSCENVRGERDFLGVRIAGNFAVSSNSHGKDFH